MLSLYMFTYFFPSLTFSPVLNILLVNINSGFITMFVVYVYLLSI